MKLVPLLAVLASLGAGASLQDPQLAAWLEVQQATWPMPPITPGVPQDPFAPP